MQDNNQTMAEDCETSIPPLSPKRSKTPEIRVDASTLMLIAVAVLLIPLIIAGFIR